MTTPTPPEPATTPGGGLPSYVQGRRPTREELRAAEGRVLTDHLPDPLLLLIVGINPSLWSAAVDAHYARPGNRMWLALHRAGLLPRVLDVSAGLADEDRRLLDGRGIGMTNLVARATARADQLTARELRDGLTRLAEVVDTHRPEVIVFAGVTTYRTAFGVREVDKGRQPEPWHGALVHVMGNPSGLNAHETVDSLGAALRAAGADARLVPPVGGHRRLR